MLDSSFFASDEVRSRDVEMPDGKKHTMWFKELPQVKFTRYQEAVRSDNEEVRANAVSHLIAMSLCEPDGLPCRKPDGDQFTAEDAARLKPQVANAIVGAILDVNGFGSKEKKD